MSELILDTNETPLVNVAQVSGNLRLTGWDQNQVQAESDEEDSLSLTADEKTGEVNVSAGGDCTLHVPRQSKIKLVLVGGDAKVKNVEGNLTIQQVSGDLVLRQVGAATVTTVGGDFNAKKVAGPLIFSASGDASARGVAGGVQGKCGGDLYLRDISDGVQVAASGDAILSLDFVTDKVYEIKAGGDVVCRVLPDVSGKFISRCGGDINVDVLGARIEGNARNKVVTMGAGTAQVSLTASGDVTLATIAADPEAMGEFGETFGNDFGMMAEEFAAQIESQIETQMSQLEEMINERMSKLEFKGAGVSSEDLAARVRDEMQRAADVARRKSANIRTRVEAKMEAAEQRAERLAEKSERHADKRRKTGTFFFKIDPHGPAAPPKPPVPPRPPTPPSSPVSDEERMAVLKMLEDGKITVEQAETLLAALDGANK